jgi:hypothetical protein
MRKPVTTIIVAAALAAAAFATPNPAEARCRGCWAGAGIVAGLIGTAIIASTAASSYGYAPYYGYPAYAGYGYAPYAGGPAYAYDPGYDDGYVPAYYSGGYAPPAYYAPRVYQHYSAPRYYAQPHFVHQAYAHGYSGGGHRHH